MSLQMKLAYGRMQTVTRKSSSVRDRQVSLAHSNCLSAESNQSSSNADRKQHNESATLRTSAQKASSDRTATIALAKVVQAHSATENYTHAATSAATSTAYSRHLLILARTNQFSPTHIRTSALINFRQSSMR